MFSSIDLSYYIISLGCSKNLVDSERVSGAMRAAGFVIAPSPEEADILVINTCGFIQTAKEESIGAIFDAVEMRKRGREDASRLDFSPKIVAVGCLTQRYSSVIAAEIPEIDFVYGIPDRRFVQRMSGKFHISTSPPAACVREPLFPGRPYAYIKISEGCSHNCSYCAIPIIRGRHRSYPENFVLDEARQAAASGARELVVVAQDISAYRKRNEGLHAIVRGMSAIEPVEWIRLMYCHPDYLDERIIDILASEKKVVPYIDIPFQHVSGRVVRSMGRKGDAVAYLALVMRLRAQVPEVRIRSTFMVGYPGESEEEFDELIDFLKAAHLDRVGVFIYSPEEGTRAYEAGDTVRRRVKNDRYNRLMAVQREISADRLGRMIGTEVQVLVEDRVDEATWIARTKYDAPEVDGIFYLTGNNILTNSIVTARVSAALEYDLIGEAVR